MVELQIIHDYKTKAMPLEFIARLHGVSLHKCIEVLHRATVLAPKSIAESKKLLKEFE